MPGMNVLHVGKRIKPFQHWEPIYIGTNQEPLYDERLTWEGRSDKMAQGYKLCLLNYQFHILDNAFLIHRYVMFRQFRCWLNTEYDYSA